jgi:hypothetical protein
MQKPAAVSPGDVVQMRKPHACGANEWAVLSTGIDIRVRCGRCGRTILMPRTQFERAAKKLLRPQSEADGAADA